MLPSTNTILLLLTSLLTLSAAIPADNDKSPPPSPYKPYPSPTPSTCAKTSTQYATIYTTSAVYKPITTISPVVITSDYITTVCTTTWTGKLVTSNHTSVYTSTSSTVLSSVSTSIFTVPRSCNTEGPTVTATLPTPKYCPYFDSSKCNKYGYGGYGGCTDTVTQTACEQDKCCPPPTTTTVTVAPGCQTACPTGCPNTSTKIVTSKCGGGYGGY